MQTMLAGPARSGLRSHSSGWWLCVAVAVAVSMLSLVTALVSAARVIVPAGPPADLDSAQNWVVLVFGIGIGLTAITAVGVWRRHQRWMFGLFLSIATFLVVNSVGFGYGDVSSRSSAAAVLAGAGIVAWSVLGRAIEGARSYS